jgi:nitrite reductase/ring-hydroxylating ferredoxin subunit
MTAPTWVAVAKVGEVARGGVLPVEVDGTRMILYRDGDTHYACQRRCPHAGFDLAEAFVSRGHLVCPLHLWRFAVDTGIFEHWGGTCLTTFAVRVVDDTIEVDPTPRRACPPPDLEGEWP